MSVVYLIESPCGRVYVGATARSINARIAEHKSVSKDINSYKGKSPIYKSMRQHGFKSFKFSTLIECDNCDLDYFESCFVDLFDSHNNGLNGKLGGSNGKKNYVSKNIIKSAKIQIQKIFNDPKLLAKARANSLTSEKQRERSLKSKALKVSRCKPYEVFDMKSFKSLGIYQGYHDAGISLGINPRSMWSYVNRGKHLHYRFKFIGGAA